MVIDPEDEEKNDFKIDIIINLDGKKLLDLVIIVNFSGGEMSRLLLAIKLATANLETPILFDEIDIGIGGSTAYKIGNKLESLARMGQIIVVTHQAQVAAHGQNHILISKKDGQSSVKILSKAERVEEISRMISSFKPAGALSDSIFVVKPNSYSFDVTLSNNSSPS
jgi:DNA repair ATPase RecN